MLKAYKYRLYPN
ncbi:MAG: helix-turn-helix domain-containing protein, partial [Methanosarcinaceae archaeon]|nr:helix-turn-helix domain-containing protein [Methanosarcinaceae archaeon]